MSIHRIDLANAHFFPDLTPIPERLHKTFTIETYDDMEADGDWAVSDAIHQLKVWEPVETAVLSSAFAGNPDSTFVDIGCHIGWYTAIAAAWGLPSIAIDGNADNLERVRRSIPPDLIRPIWSWIDKGWDPEVAWPEPCIVKMDIEGNERYAVDAMWDLFDVGSVTHCLMEVSPVFNKSYPKILLDLITIGYECWMLPQKQAEPAPLDDTRAWLEAECASLHDMPLQQFHTLMKIAHQFNAVFCKEDSLWG